ncbi:MAG: FAD-dependent oxidoreductase [Phycisphaerae bacterium]|nr:FAD-dependent oxidoreductase [Phycisphaerae bacterium]
MAPRHVVIVGAGIIGLSTAWFLLKRGVRVTILDREAIGESASCGNAGLLSIGHYPLTRPGVSWRGMKWMLNSTSPLFIKPRISSELISWLWRFHRHCNQRHLDRCMAVLCDMGFKTLAIYEDMIREESISCDYAREGWLDVVLDPKNMDHAEAEAQSLAQYDYTYRRLSGDELRARDPIFRDEVAGAIHYLDSAHAHPGDFLQGLAAACVRRGATLSTDAHVTAITRARSGGLAGVTLVDGTNVEGDAVVLAAGVWCAELAKSAQVRIPMVGARGYHVQLHGLPHRPSTGMVLHETFVAVTPMRRGASNGGRDELRLAGTLEIDRLGQPWRSNRLAMLSRGAERYLRGLDQGTQLAEWAGYRPCTSDGMPVLGFARDVPGLLIAGGHAMMGMTLGPITGQAATELLFGEQPCFDVSMLDANRFR